MECQNPECKPKEECYKYAEQIHPHDREKILEYWNCWDCNGTFVRNRDRDNNEEQWIMDPRQVQSQILSFRKREKLEIELRKR